MFSFHENIVKNMGLKHLMYLQIPPCQKKFLVRLQIKPYKELWIFCRVVCGRLAKGLLLRLCSKAKFYHSVYFVLERHATCVET